ncbi:MAG: hypothetical protein ACKOX3_01865 [Bacteroidota bacterium]
MKKSVVLFVFFSLIKLSLLGQINTTQFGFCYRPIFSSSYFRTGPKDFENNNIYYTLAQHSGYSTGVLVRRGITKKLTFESGILYVKRNYDLTIKDTNDIYKSDFSIIGYEIPLSALIYIQLDPKIWMSASMGGSIDIFPSDIFTYEPTYMLQFSARKSKINAGVLANLGWEYRNGKKGTYYFGASYHRSISTIYDTMVEYYEQRDFGKLPDSKGKTTLQGDYLTFDLRFYFHENPDKKTKKK